MDQWEFDIGSGDLPHRGSRSQDLVRVMDGALPGSLVRRARAVIASLGRERLRSSYFTTFWLPEQAHPAHPGEEAGRAPREAPRPPGWAGGGGWIRRPFTPPIPGGFHFDQD